MCLAADYASFLCASGRRGDYSHAILLLPFFDWCIVFFANAHARLPQAPYVICMTGEQHAVRGENAWWLLNSQWHFFDVQLFAAFSRANFSRILWI
jgi:hypothetical protein